MAATIRWMELTATIDDYVWTSEDADLAALLNAMLDPDGPSGADPNPELNAAQDAIDEIGGVLVAFDRYPHVRDRVY